MTQHERVIEYMQENGTITQKQANDDIGCSRLAAVISDLKKKKGYKIGSEMITVRNRYGDASRVARYYLEDENAS